MTTMAPRRWTWPTRTARAPDGTLWSVHVARGDQWQGWSRLDRVRDEVLEPLAILSPLPALVGELVDAVPATVRWASHVAARRRDWLVTVRPAGGLPRRATAGAVLVELVDGRAAAAARAEELLATVRRTGPPAAP